MLTVEILKANPKLSGLSDEQLTAIAQMSSNDENTVISTRIGALHGQYDTDIFNITGINKNANEKSYDYAKRVLSKYKTDVESVTSLNNEITTLKADKAKLEKQIQQGTQDEAIKQQLKDTETRLTQLQQQYDADKTKFANAEKDYKSKLHNIQVNAIFDTAISKLNFKDGISENIRSVMLQDAKNKILTAYTPELTQDGKDLIFRDQNGNIYNNPGANLAPYTTLELLKSSESLKDILGTAKPGAGTKPYVRTPSATLNISAARSQVEADDIIAKYLMEQGKARFSDEFVAEFEKLRGDLGVDKLPLR